MKKNSIAFMTILSALIISCDHIDKKHDGHTANEPKTTVDSLMKDIDDGHMVGMSKIGKLHNTQKQVQGVIDSIAKLPAKVQQSAAPYVAKLQSLIKDLEYADFGMDKWMTEFQEDSAINNLEQRIKYLTDEKMKVGKMKEALLNGLQKADSLLKEKF